MYQCFILSTKDTEYMTIYTGNFYLNMTQLIKDPVYVRIIWKIPLLWYSLSKASQVPSS